MSLLLLNANSLHIPLVDKSVHCVVTSPPYWNLRDYSVAGQLGLEPTIEEYVENMVLVFREVWRVLRDDGTCWLNLGDSYINNPGNGRGGESPDGGIPHRSGKNKIAAGLKVKDLAGIPWRVAFALQADGWYLRSDIIWAKSNPMPESVTDRPTKAHEYLFLLAKSERYFYDADAVREDLSESTINRWGNGGTRFDGHDDYFKERDGGKKHIGQLGDTGLPPSGNRNRRTVWTIATAPYSGAHFATFPPALVEPCIKAGTSERGCCPRCGKPWVRVTSADGGTIGRSWHDHVADPIRGNRAENEAKGGNGYRRIDHGFRPACTCPAADPVPCVVLDPFAGSGTTLMVARSLGRHAVGLDLSFAYLHDQARARLDLDRLEAWTNGRKDGAAIADLPLFNFMEPST